MRDSTIASMRRQQVRDAGAPLPAAVASRNDGTAGGMIAGEESAGLLVRGLALRAALGARPRSLLHERDRDHGMGRHDAVVTVADPNTPEPAARAPPRAHPAPQHDDDLRHRVTGRDVEQPRLDRDPVAQAGKRRALGIAVGARIA